MPIQELSRINLNLLVCLQALLEERSVTRASERLNLSQSAVSKSLSRLRELTGDPLFTRTAHGLMPTSRALTIQEQLKPILDELWKVVQPQVFDPLDCDRHFSIALPETANHLKFQNSLAEILQSAPKVKIKLMNLTLKSLEELAAGKVDLVALPDDLDCGQHRISGLHRKRLYKDKLVCLVRENHPCLKRPWTLEACLALGHIGIGAVTDRVSITDQTLAKLGLDRDIAVAVGDFHSATQVCESTDLMFVSLGNWAAYAEGLYRVVSLPMPIEVEPIAYDLYWHEMHHQDLAHQWLRSYFRV
ncbi:LysR family transcriptional regulator [Endozoicomonas arenosclerae]|uniref:LysR family transcriptional regulator n=1 Tax=Endozoicomonas arenosclerae TaxID=1633495 RepID=UPI0007815199|nr:LysR family transcriptional regulator [Endozoicomonas arenosclerae]